MEVLAILFVIFILFSVITSAITSIQEKIKYNKAKQEYETVIKLAYGNLQDFDKYPIDEFMREIKSDIIPKIPTGKQIEYDHIMDTVRSVGKKYFEGRKDDLA